MRKITDIILHCSYTKPEYDVSVDTIRKWHTDGNGWKDVGYHWVIRRNGRIEEGRSEKEIGAHVRGHNSHSIGVCLVGGMNAAGDPDCNFTAAQWAALASLVANIKQRYPEAVVSGHRDYAAKECPCFDAKAWAETVHA